MKPTDLMIGDWVMIKDYPMKAMPKQMSSEYYTRSLVEIEPIPLTPEIFEKNGFKKLTDNPYRTYYELGLNEYRNKILWYKGSITIDYEGEDVYLCDCENVHELQHALKLCGINKEIIL